MIKSDKLNIFRIYVYIIKYIIKYFIFFFFRWRSFREFHHFPFNPNEKLPPNAENVMKICCNILDDLNVKYRLTDGTILGLYRQNYFIPHDNDIDIDVLDCYKSELIIHKMKSAGMSIGRIAIYNGKVHQLVFYNKGQYLFDIVFWYTSGKKIENYSEKGFKRVQPSEYFENLGYRFFFHKRYPVPSKLEEWLVLRYGEDWKIPKTYKGDWKEECFDLVPMD